MSNEEMDTIRDCIESRADNVLKEQRELPIYQHSGSYAQEHGELDAYFASQKANTACKEAIEQAIPTHYHDNRLDSKEAVQQVVGQFGVDRTAYVLAATVQEKDPDGRISRQNKQWAKTAPVAEDIDAWNRNRTLAFVVDRVNPGLVDLFLNHFRREQLLEQAQDTDKGQPDRKQSIKKQLAAPHAPSDKPPTKSNDREVR